MEKSEKPFILVIGCEFDRKSGIEAFFAENNITVKIMGDLSPLQAANQVMMPSCIIFSQRIIEHFPGTFVKHLNRLEIRCPLVMLYSGSNFHALSSIPSFFSTINTLKIDAFMPENVPLPYLLKQVQSLIHKKDTLEDLLNLNKHLSKLSVTDSLTGLYNHGYLIETLDKEIKRAKRTLETISCIMIDIDHFKSLNDSFGHQFGDFVLKEFSEYLKKNTRETDTVGRYGGEEFLIILPNTNIKGTYYLAEKLRAKLEQSLFKDSKYECRITASFGCAYISEKFNWRMDLLLQNADYAMYQAKSTGRNRVVAYENEGQEIQSFTEPQIIDVHEKTFNIHLISDDDNLMNSLRSLTYFSENQFHKYNNKTSYSRFCEQAYPDLVLVDDKTEWIKKETFLRELRDLKKKDPVPIVLLTQFNIPGMSGSLMGIDDFIAQDSIGSEDFTSRIKLLLIIRHLQEHMREINSKLQQAKWRLVEDGRLKSLGQLSAGVGHDLNNILTAILGRIQILRKQIKTPDAERSLDVIEQAAKDGSQIIQRLNRFVKPNKNTAMEPLLLKCVVDDAIQIIKPKWKDQAEKEGRLININCSVQDDIIVSGKESELHEIFTNLLANAIDAMPRGGEINIIALKVTDSVIIKISDNGAGMSRDVLKKCFEPFFSLKARKGTGLGLSIVRELVWDHNGEITIESELGRGTTINLKLPLSKAIILKSISSQQYSDEMDREKGMETYSDFFRNRRILLIEDNESVREVLCEYLIQLGCNVDSASNGIEGFSLFNKNDYFLVITDYGMPGISGLEVARKIKDVAPDTIVTLITGWDEFDDQGYLTGKGVDFSLKKPINLSDIENLLKEVVNSKEFHRNGLP